MDLQEEWSSLNTDVDVQAKHYRIDRNLINLESRGIYGILLRNLHYKLIWVRVLAAIPFIFSLITSGALQHVLQAIFAAFIGGWWAMNTQLKHLPRDTDYSHVTQKLLAESISQIRSILNIEKYWGYIFIPLAPFTGIMLFKLTQHNQIEFVFGAHHWQYNLTLCVFLGISGIYLAAKMNALAFGKYLSHLEQFSASLSKEEAAGP